ncbi:MAG: hypothetical protein AAF414_12770 [Pseudomonadota bacterium]
MTEDTKKKLQQEPATLKEGDIKSGRRMGRRTLLTMLVGVTGASAAACVPSQNYSGTGITDADPSDPIGNGRGQRTTGITDSDTGQFADPVGNGRGARTSGITDNDPSDPIGNGRGQRASGITDNDPSDPIGNGRGRVYTGRSDSDGGQYADPGGYGR